MLNHFIDLLASYLTWELMQEYIYPLFLLYFIASVPSVIRLFFSWR